MSCYVSVPSVNKPCALTCILVAPGIPAQGQGKPETLSACQCLQPSKRESINRHEECVSHQRHVTTPGLRQPAGPGKGLRTLEPPNSPFCGHS